MSKDSYKKAIVGKLAFKGSAPISKAKKAIVLNNSNNNIAPILGDDDGPEIVLQNGTGRITSSSITVHGHGTKFMDELSVGDALIITHPITLLEETKIIRMVLSNISIGKVACAIQY